MDSRRFLGALWAVLVISVLPRLVLGGDIVHEDDKAPKLPGCSNNFVLGLQTCLVALLSRWFKLAGESFIKVPFFGAVSYLTLAVSPFCIAFAVVWAVHCSKSFAWIGQVILGIPLIITILQIVRVPNLKVKAWLADKDAEALRYQKLLVEEEEAAQKRQAELLEKKRMKKLRQRMKKLRQKEQKAKDLTTDADLTTDVSTKVSLPSNIDLTSGSGTPSPRAPSELYAQEASLGEDPCSLEPTGSPDPDAEANFKSHRHPEDADQNTDHQKQMENSRRQATGQRILSKPTRTFRNGFNSGQVPAAKASISIKHDNYKDPKAAASINWHKIWTRKSKPDNEEEGSSVRVDRELRDQPVVIDNSEVLIGSICVTLGQKNDRCQDLSSLRCGPYQEKLAKTDSSMSNANCSGAKLWKPVACQENCDYATIRGDKRENNINGHSAETASQISLDKNPLASGGMDDGSSERYKDLLAVHRSTNVSGPMLLSIKDAEAFLARSKYPSH